MGKILNLISLKSKADAAGVGTTATNTTPSLCPQKSAIAGYVTGGTNSVSISGTWADNQLVDEAYVAVGKTITGTTTEYQSQSMGTASVSSDVPANGGSRAATATFTYQSRTKTTYSSGDPTYSEWQTHTETITGNSISGSNLGTTEKARTKLGTSTCSKTIGGVTKSSSADVYQAANTKTTSYLYRNVSVGTSTAPDIAAKGGKSRAYALVSYEQATKYTYTSGSSTTGSYTSTSEYIYGGYVNANSKGTTISLRNSTGSTSTPSGTVAGATRTGTAVTIYQAANYVSTIVISAASGYSTIVTYDIVPASGGKIISYQKDHQVATFTLASESTTTSTPANCTWVPSLTIGVYSDPNNMTSTGTQVKANTSTSSRSCTMKVTSSPVFSYASGYTTLPSPTITNVTHYPTLTQAGTSGSAGFTTTIAMYMHSPKVAFKSSSGTHYTVPEKEYNGLSGLILNNQTFDLAGTATYVDVTYNDPRCGYITIKRDSTTILAKTYIGGANSNRNLTLSSGLSSSFTGTLNITFSST